MLFDCLMATTADLATVLQTLNPPRVPEDIPKLLRRLEVFDELVVQYFNSLVFAFNCWRTHCSAHSQC
jgi:hypothetical protein